MHKRVQIGLVGDFSAKIYTHTAMNDAITHCMPHLHFDLETPWIATENVTEEFLSGHAFEGFWIAPGSPYKNDDGVYRLIRWCRENDFPLYGTCGGFQYMIVEYARNVLGFKNAGHEERDGDHAEHLIIHKLTCSLKGAREDVLVSDKQSWLYRVLGRDRIQGSFNCSYGVNPVYQTLLNQYPFVITAESETGEARAFELKAHRFFAGTLFQPQLDSTPERPNALVLDFLTRCSLP